MISREDLNAYLLHRMPEDQRDAFAEKWFADPELYQQVVDAESELLDAYVRGALSRNERGQIERYLLTSEVQRQKLAFAAALHALLPKPVRRSVPWVGVAAAAAIVLLAGISIWVVQQNRNLNKQIASLRQDARPAGGGVYLAQLPAGTVRGPSGSSLVVVPEGASLLRLEVELEDAEESDSFAGELAISGRTVWKEEPLHAERRGKVFLTTIWIPGGVLVPGNYTLTLRKGGAVRYYNLVVQRGAGL